MECTLLGIIDKDNVALIGNSITSMPLFYMQTPVAGTYTHVSGATNTSDMVISSCMNTQMWPSLSVKDIKVILDGVEVSASGEYLFDKMNICEIYDIYNTLSLVNKIQTKVGTFTANPIFSKLGAELVARHSIVYTFISADKWMTNVTFTAYEKLNLKYFGFTQQGILSGNTIKLYIPKTLPISNGTGTLDYRTIANHSSNFASDINVTTEYWENPVLPPDRWLEYSEKIGVASGYVFDWGVS